MFNLKAHKEIIAYKIYTEANMKRQWIPFIEFKEQYHREQSDRKPNDKLERDYNQLLINANSSKSHNVSNDTIDINHYAKFYSVKDCVTQIDGMYKFYNNLSEVFTQTNIPFIGINQFISISAVGYDFARIYGRFNECYQLSSKPQNLIQRCVLEGHSITDNNEKKYIVDRIQDFDAVSLYPSVMSIMDGVPKGCPKVIPDNCTLDQLRSYEMFFIEVNINKLICQSPKPYRLGQVFKHIEAVSKIFCNEPVNYYYIDKIMLIDMMVFYDIKYKLIRGYYFDDGFNNRVNDFIKTLFDLRFRYKQEHNPLEKTIKLLLNPIDGKSILKLMTDEIKVFNQNKIISSSTVTITSSKKHHSH